MTTAIAEAALDPSFVRDLVRDVYADIVRPSIDPVVFFNVMLGVLDQEHA